MAKQPAVPGWYYARVRGELRPVQVTRSRFDRLVAWPGLVDGWVDLDDEEIEWCGAIPLPSGAAVWGE